MPDSRETLAQLGISAHRVRRPSLSRHPLRELRPSRRRSFPSVAPASVSAVPTCMRCWQPARSRPARASALEQPHSTATPNPAYRFARTFRTAHINGQPIRFRWLIGADGQASSVRRWAGLDRVAQALSPLRLPHSLPRRPLERVRRSPLGAAAASSTSRRSRPTASASSTSRAIRAASAERAPTSSPNSPRLPPALPARRSSRSSAARSPHPASCAASLPTSSPSSATPPVQPTPSPAKDSPSPSARRSRSPIPSTPARSRPTAALTAHRQAAPSPWVNSCSPSTAGPPCRFAPSAPSPATPIFFQELLHAHMGEKSLASVLFHRGPRFGWNLLAKGARTA